MSLLTRGSVIAVSLLVGGCVTSMLGGGSDAADAKQGPSPAQTASAPATPAAAPATDQTWAGRDLPDYRTSSSRTAALSAEAMAATPAPQPQLSLTGSQTETPPARPVPPTQDVAAATPPPAQPAPQRAVAAPPAAPPQPAAPQRPSGQQLAQAQPQRNSAPQGQQRPAGEAGPSEEQLQRAVQAYAGVSGGYYLNEKCSVLNAAQKREYEWHLSVLTAALSRQVRPDVLEKARSVTRQNVGEQFKDCGDKSKQLVGEAFTAAQRMNQSVTGATYKGKESDLQLSLNKFGAVTMALTVEQRCDRIPEPTRGRVYSALDEVGASLSKQGAADQVKQIRSRVTEQVEGAFKSGKLTKEQACDARSTQQLQPVLSELKRMQCEIAGSKEACADLKS
ncbi:hypothetical protein ABIE65_002579 [Constrictibacter sp. MBR-5]|jgi:hypothetical protein|uniref:hypothetical protein n=1 Tax=Constrictibacter sp. MBR-5 TaxID=3156467 RepID=UPI00339AD790